jgi:hypothetical protein
LQAYFPHISHSEGLPLRVQDVKGNEWTFQFRFWPNNNSRMYVLEGVTPCIQAMELRAGDTGMHQSRELYLHTLILSRPYGLLCRVKPDMFLLERLSFLANLM